MYDGTQLTPGFYLYRREPGRLWLVEVLETASGDKVWKYASDSSLHDMSLLQAKGPFARVLDYPPVLKAEESACECVPPATETPAASETRIARAMRAMERARPLCPNHRDKQRDKPCLACTIEKLQRELDSLRAALRFYADANNWSGRGATCLEFDPELVPARFTGSKQSGLDYGWEIAAHALRSTSDQPSQLEELENACRQARACLMNLSAGDGSPIAKQMQKMIAELTCVLENQA